MVCEICFSGAGVANGYLNRSELTREKFVEKVWQWKGESGGQITGQLRRLGCSMDWSREQFTMDPHFTRAVVKVFVDLHKKGLIYRDKRLVNWDPKFQSAISDLEVETRDMAGKFWTLRYPLEDGSGAIEVATTRPETMLADMAVAVHPDDERYKAMVGKKLKQPITGRFRTGPASRRNIRFAWSGDTVGQGWGIDETGMKSYATIAKHQPDFFLHSGDTIYADIGSPAVPRVARTLEEFRLKHDEVNRTVYGLNALAAIGVVGSLLLTDTPFSMQAYIGVIMLAGIVVSNAILLVDYANTLRHRDKMALRPAIELAGRHRLRPILMTSVCTMLGLVPMSLGIGEGSELQVPLARVVIGGLLTSTLITLVFVPAMYTLFEEGWRGLLKKGPAPTAAH